MNPRELTASTPTSAYLILQATVATVDPSRGLSFLIDYHERVTEDVLIVTEAVMRTQVVLPLGADVSLPGSPAPLLELGRVEEIDGREPLGRWASEHWRDGVEM